MRAAAAPRQAAMATGCLLLNAMVWGCVWWPLRWLERHGMHPLWGVVLTYGCACVLVSCWRPRAWRALATQRWLWWLVLACGVNEVCFNWAMIAGDVVRAILLFYLMPVWMMLLARVLLGERLTPLALMRMALALAGAYVILQPEGGGLPLPQRFPDWLALAGGVAFACNNVLLRKFAGTSAEGPALATFLGGTLLGLLLALPLAQALPGGVPFTVDAPVLAAAAGLGLVFLLGNMALQFGAAQLSAAVIGMVMLSEVVFAALSSALVGGEYPGARVYAGGALILAAMVAGVLLPRRRSAA